MPIWPRWWRPTVTRRRGSRRGRALHADASVKCDMATAALGAKRNATRQMREAWKEARQAYQRLAALARTLFFRRPGVLTALGLDRAQPRTLNGFSCATLLLFGSERYTPEVRSVLAAHGYDEARLSAERAKLEPFDVALSEQALFRGDAKFTKAQQREALQKMREWHMTYCKIARIALRERPELLAKLGIAVRTGKSPAQRAAPLKAIETRRRNREERALAASVA